ncbi:hypothetical protein RJ640_028670 [Escallonia rubra]|uniref:Uncharacterized protein n=1 Tax=Escallonia rubra TaxID=112253 RepID=A0AA88RFS4_9ASTE|nr:hypothetical protein RJ640_028670 [Escallonia rubra]
MAISSSCCFKLCPPPPISVPQSLPPNTAHFAWPKKERSWRSQIVVGVACMIVSAEMGSLVSNNPKEVAIAGEMELAVEKTDKNANKWSDKRMCPPWRVNSLENIVPENLPRPSAHRRWEAVGFPKVAPATKVSTRTSSTCFSM